MSHPASVSIVVKIYGEDETDVFKFDSTPEAFNFAEKYTAGTPDKTQLGIEQV